MIINNEVVHESEGLPEVRGQFSQLTKKNLQKTLAFCIQRWYTKSIKTAPHLALLRKGFFFLPFLEI